MFQTEFVYKIETKILFSFL